MSTADKDHFRPSQVFERILNTLYRHRRAVLTAIQVLLVVLANQVAFWLRFDGSVPVEQRPYDTTLLPLLIAVRLTVFYPFRLHEGVWRYASILELRNILLGVIASSAVFWALTHQVLGIRQYPRSVFIIDALVLVCLMGGLRLARRLYAASSRHADARRVLIYGAGDAGEMIARDMLMRLGSRAIPVGFIDDDAAKRGLTIHGVEVVGGADQLDHAIAAFRPQDILIAIPSAEPRTLRTILKNLQRGNLPIKTLPRMQDIPSGEVTLNEIRPLSLSDLLSRAPAGLEPERVRSLINGQRVLVTGAGGSIGSELCRQIANANPERLIMLDRYENGLFAAHAEVASRLSSDALTARIGDITDSSVLRALFTQERPSVVFHAAAHKHVPLMEIDPCEAVKNNVRGTRLVADAAAASGVRQFVLISTDKAVNPTSVMGATKRLAELIIQDRATHADTTFTSVRFGNVLGSNGSVVPTFLSQIKNGGPVTVTHPEMRRYFMLIPEAVQLVLHAAALGGRGAAYVLEMGDQIRIADMARDLIRLAGYSPDEDIEIDFIGIRPGEKLAEELVGPDERADDCEIDGVKRLTPFAPVDPLLIAATFDLEEKAISGDNDAVRVILARLMPSMGGGVKASTLTTR